MKKYFFMLLAAATLSLGFSACGDDEKDEPTPNNPEQPGTPEQPKVINFEDYSSAIGMTFQKMMSTYGEPTNNFGNFYSYAFDKGNVASLLIIVNPENNLVYSLTEILKKDAYKAEDIRAYFASKYNAYEPVEVEYEDEETGEKVTTTTYSYGNTKDIAEATLLITVNGNSDVTYSNPKNVYEEPEAEGFEGLEPDDAVSQFLGADIEDVLDEYEGLFMPVGETMYMAGVEDSEYLMSFALSVQNGKVVSVILLYNEDLSDDDIIEYYKQLGYTVIPEGEDEEGEPIYSFTKDVDGAHIIINYSAGRGVAFITQGF